MDWRYRCSDIVNYTRDTHTFSSLGGYGQMGFELSGIGNPAMINAARMSAGVFPALGVQPLMGRFFTPQEDQQHQQVTLLSYATWEKRFQGHRHPWQKNSARPQALCGDWRDAAEF